MPDKSQLNWVSVVSYVARNFIMQNIIGNRPELYNVGAARGRRALRQATKPWEGHLAT